MKHLIKLFVVVIIFILGISCKNDKNESLILKDITIIDIESGELSSNSLLIENNIIKQIGDYNQLTKNNLTKIIECNGKYLIPGLFDMHMHIAEHENSIPMLEKLLKNGITSIRDMGGIADTVALAKDMIRKGEIKGPDIYFAGVTLDGPQTNDPFHYQVRDTTDLRDIVHDLKKLDVDFLKVHNYFPNNRLVELKNVGNSFGLNIAGHIPVGIGPMELDSVGIKCVEHINSLISGLVLKKSNGINNITDAFTMLDSVYVSKLSKYYRDNEIAVTPTLYTLNDLYSNLENEESRNIGIRMMNRFHEITLWMNQESVLLLAGSDMGPVNSLTINALHYELEMMVKSGLSTLEALKTATINPSRYLKIDKKYGSIDINKIANLLILNSNPLDNITNTKDIYFVIKNGEVMNSLL